MRAKSGAGPHASLFSLNPASSLLARKKESSRVIRACAVCGGATRAGCVGTRAAHPNQHSLPPSLAHTLTRSLAHTHTHTHNHLTG